VKIIRIAKINFDHTLVVLADPDPSSVCSKVLEGLGAAPWSIERYIDMVNTKQEMGMLWPNFPVMLWPLDHKPRKDDKFSVILIRDSLNCGANYSYSSKITFYFPDANMSAEDLEYFHEKLNRVLNEGFDIDVEVSPKIQQKEKIKQEERLSTSPETVDEPLDDFEGP